MMKIKFIKLFPSAKIPAYAHPNGDAGFDIFALNNVLLKPFKQTLVKCGIASEIPPGYFVSFRDRSGLALKSGLHVLAGVIDSSYRGEWGVVLINFQKRSYRIIAGDRIAQGIVVKIPAVELIETKKINDSNRGDGGFGSTGK